MIAYSANKIRYLMVGFLMHILWVFPINKKKVILKSFRGQNCGDNPGAIYQELRKRRPDLKFYWVMRDKTTVIPGAITIKNGSLSELYHLATARLWIDNKRKGMWCSKRRGQFYIQTWHAGICGKKVEADAKDALSDYYLMNAAKDSKNADLFLSDSKWTTALYRRAFYYSGEILEAGIPRADIFFKDQKPVREKVYRILNVEEDTKLLLYAPTFRVDGSLDAYGIDFSALYTALAEKFGGKWKIILRLHPNIANKYKGTYKDSNILIDGSQYQDINELIAASEILITDYSSCMFDAMEAGKRVFLFATDIENYDKDRGRYFKFSELPFALAENNSELSRNIKTFKEEYYRSEVERFTNAVGLFEGGHASEKICDYLDTIL